MNTFGAGFLGIACLAAAGIVRAAPDAGIYQGRCSTCHDAGIANAPRVGDKAEWTRRAAPGRDALYRSALRGVPNTAMTAKGGFTGLTDAEVRSAVDYMLERAGVDAPGPPSIAAPSSAAAAGTPRDPVFLLLDKNKDGYLTRGEAARDPAAARNFVRYDADRDGRLSEEEYQMLDAALMRANAQTRVADGTLAANVGAALGKTRGLVAKDVKVEAADGVVALKGVVDDGEQVALAELAAKRVRGVRRVDNRLISKHVFTWD